MSDAFPMVAIDKVEFKLTIKVELKVRLEKMRKATGLSMNALVNAILDEATSKVKLDESDREAIINLIDANIAKRAALKLKNGVK